MDGSTSTSTSRSVKNQGRISDKRKISGCSWKKNSLLLQVLLQQYQRCHSVWACCVSFIALFSEPRRFGVTSFCRTQYPVVIEKDTRRAVARPRLEIWLWVLLDKHRAGLQLLLQQVCEMCFCHISRAAEEQEAMRECDIHHARPIRTSSAINLSRKLELDLCCDLLPHLQGVSTTYL